MDHPTSPAPDERPGPLLRDPPPPPGYVDPLDESQLLEDLSQPGDSSVVQGAATGSARPSRSRRR